MAIRSLLFGLTFYASTLVLSILLSPSLLLPRGMMRVVAYSWVRLSLWIVRATLGIRHDVRGWENVPSGPFIIASKHQSAWDTLIYNVVIPDCVFVLKRELFFVPFWGWYLWRMRMIGVDRSAGARALKSMAEQALDRLGDGRSIVIFPQGTRTTPGARRPYLPGAAALYRMTDVPVVPVALNSGLFWPRRKFEKHSGTATLQFLEPIPPGLDKRTFLKRLEAAIEPATSALEREACDQFNLTMPSSPTH